MSSLDVMFEKFGHSKAIFSAKKSSDGEIQFELKEAYDPSTVDLDKTDPVVKLLISNYHESFDRHDGCFKKGDSIRSTTNDMRISLRSALVNASPLKNPQQSKLYKWFVEYVYRIDEEVLIALYRYVAQNSTDQFRFYDGSNNPHAKNLVAIVEKLRDKYER